MFPQVPRAGLTLPKILTGINKTLNVANQIIPIYVQAKPMIQNAKSAFKVAQGFLTNSKQTSNQKSSNINNTNNLSQRKKEVTFPQFSNPTFFL